MPRELSAAQSSPAAPPPAPRHQRAEHRLSFIKRQRRLLRLHVSLQHVRLASLSHRPCPVWVLLLVVFSFKHASPCLCTCTAAERSRPVTCSDGGQTHVVGAPLLRLVGVTLHQAESCRHTGDTSVRFTHREAKGRSSGVCWLTGQRNNNRPHNKQQMLFKTGLPVSRRVES